MMLFSNLTRSLIYVLPKRYIRRKVIIKAWPNDWVPFHWSRPEQRPGWENPEDLEPLGEPNLEDLQRKVRYSSNLKKLDVNDPMRKIFSLDHAKRSEFNKSKVDEFTRDIGLIHEVDYANSLESRIINLTFTLKQMIENVNSTQIVQNGRFNGHHRFVAHKVRRKRYRYLCELKQIHSERYQKIISELKIEPEENKINVPVERPWRKKQMRALAIEYSREVIEKKVDEYLRSLEVEKVNFEKEKQETMKWIEEQEKRLKQS